MDAACSVDAAILRVNHERHEQHEQIWLAVLTWPVSWFFVRELREFPRMDAVRSDNAALNLFDFAVRLKRLANYANFREWMPCLSV
jgi:hypothetical protein